MLLWLRIIRPQTLFASLCPVLVVLVSMTETIDLPTALITIVSSLSLQILSNLINDYYDYRRGTDKQGRVGFKRALAEGDVTEKQMLSACLIMLGVALLTGLYLVLQGGWVIIAIGLSALLFAWLYTATSFSLSYLGIADIFVFLYYGVIASSGTYYLQTGHFSCQMFYAGAVCGLISMCVLLINNLRDVDDDRRVGKRTLPVRFGRKAGIGLMTLVVLLMPLMAYLAFKSILPSFILLPGLLLLRAVSRAEGTAYNRCLVAAGLMNVCYTLLVILSNTL